MAGISQTQKNETKKKAWSTPVLRVLSGEDAEWARKLLLEKLEPSKKVPSRGAR